MRRFESYNRKEDKIPFDLEYFNKITVVVFLTRLLMSPVGTGVGKSFMSYGQPVLFNGRNVLYITMEMAEKIVERIDANLLNVPIQEISGLLR